jgi:hypothetical protein
MLAKPRRIKRANRDRLTQQWLAGRVDVHLHRKVWRTELFQRALWSTPEDLKHMRIPRLQDLLLDGYALLNMRNMHYYIETLGEMRHYGW